MPTDTSTGQRTVVQDPLAPNAREQAPNRSLQLGGVMTPHTPDAKSLTPQDGLTQALSGVEGILAQEFEKQKDDWITDGKVAYQSGATEQQMLATGNAFTAQGYQTLQARDKVNQWYTQQTVAMEDSGKQTDPTVYAAQLKEQRASILSQMPDDTSRKVASAAFEDMSPRLASTQAIKNNEYNRGQRVNSFSSLLYSTAPTSSTASTKADPNQPLALSPVPVEPVMQPSANDRDVGIRTILGEAANEGADGMAAVAHVMRNRATDGRWPSSIAGVALQPKQFSAWNTGAGGNNLVSQYNPGDPIYDRAGQVFDAVMSGNHVDPTGGATHYYSPVGMQKLVYDGDQSNAVPKWLDEATAESGGRIKIGGHIFVGRTSGDGAAPRPSVDVPNAPPAPTDGTPAPQVTALSLAAGTQGDINAVPAQEHVGVTGIAQAAGKNEVQQLINGYAGLNNEDKATAVSDAMRRGFDAGDTSLFNDAGGIAALHKLGAKPGEVDEVIKAQKRYNDKQQADFSVDREKYRNDILSRADKGEGIDSLLGDIDGKLKSGFINDVNARGLAASAADKVRAQGQASKMDNPDMLNELGGLYQQIATGGDFKTLAVQGKAIAEKYGAPEADVKSVVTKMFSDSQTYQNKLREDTKAAAKTKLEQDGIKSGVDRAISQGYGLSNVAGSVKITNDAGQPQTVTAQEYGIAQIKDKWGKQYADAVAQGTMTAAQAKPELERKVMLELQNHDVVDKQQQAQFVGSLAGNIIAKDGTVKPAAAAAYNTWLTLKQTPGISSAYLSKIVGDDGTRNLLEHAFLLDSGDLSKEQSLLKAHEILNDPNRDPNDKINKDAIWQQKMDVDLPKALLERTDPGFFDRLFDTKDRSERYRILNNNTAAQNYVTNRAEAYHYQNPNEFGEVSLTKGIQDLQANSVPVMGNLIITKPGKELDKTMGVSGFGPTAAEDAVSSYIRQNGEKIWGKSYTDRDPSTARRVANAIGETDTALSPQGVLAAVAPGTFDSKDRYANASASHPPVNITYNPELGVMTVDLYKDKDMKQTLGAPKHFNVKSIGDEYVKQQTTPGTWATAWNSMFKGTAKAVKDINDRAHEAPTQ